MFCESKLSTERGWIARRDGGINAEARRGGDARRFGGVQRIGCTFTSCGDDDRGLGGDGIVGYCGYVSRSQCGRIFSEVLNGCTVDFGIGLTLEGIFLYCLGW